MLLRDEAMRELNHVYEIRPRRDHRGVDLISDALPLPGPLHRIALESFLIAEWQMIRP